MEGEGIKPKEGENETKENESKPKKKERQHFYARCSDMPERERKRITRVGVIPFVKFRGITSFALAVDLRHKELTDCGGLREANETLEMTGARELYEESACIFDFRNQLHLLSASPVSIWGRSCVVFLEVWNLFQFGFPTRLSALFRYNLHLIKSSFAHCCQRNPENSTLRTGFERTHLRRFCENSNMFWVRGDDLCDLVFSQKPVLRSSLTSRLRRPLFPLWFHPKLYSATRQTIRDALRHLLS